MLATPSTAVRVQPSSSTQRAVWLVSQRTVHCGKEGVLSAVDEHQQAWKMCILALCQPSDTFLGWLTFALPRCSMTSRR